MNEVAAIREFLEQANNLRKFGVQQETIISTIFALQKAINTVTEVPVRLLLATEEEVKTIREKAGLDL